MMLKPGFMTRFFTAVRLGLGLALVGTPLITHAQVSEATRARVAELQKDPNFKLKGSARKCMSGELVDPDCDQLIKNQITLYEGDDEYKRLVVEKARLDGEKARLDAKKASIDAKKASIDHVWPVASTHFFAAIKLLEFMSFTLFPNPEVVDLRKRWPMVPLDPEIMKLMRPELLVDVSRFIIAIHAKVDAKRPITQDDLREFDTLFLTHFRKVEQFNKDDPYLRERWAKEDHITRTFVVYAASKPRFDAAVSR